MPVPHSDRLMLTILQALADETETRTDELRDRVAAAEGLSRDDVHERKPGGDRSVFMARVSWAVRSLEAAGLLERVRRGIYQVTLEGKSLLSHAASHAAFMNQLEKYPSYVDWRRRTSAMSLDRQEESKSSPNLEIVLRQNGHGTETPEEALDRAARQLRSALEADVLQRVRDAAPAFLERAVVDLLIAMGYGGGDATMGRVTGRSGDGGIDGTIREDALGLDEVYVQAKKYAEGNAVGEGDLRNFAGAIDAAGTTKGVFVTTASFTRAARDYVARSPKRIILIDGAELARLMVQHGVGVRTRVRYEVKRVDEDYFDEETL